MQLPSAENIGEANGKFKDDDDEDDTNKEENEYEGG